MLRYQVLDLRPPSYYLFYQIYWSLLLVSTISSFETHRTTSIDPLRKMAPRDVELHPNNFLPPDLGKKNVDVVVIGSGPVGRQLAAKTAVAGLSTVIVEEELFGGECPFWACIPSKALLRPAEALNTARMMTGAKQLIADEPRIDTGGVLQRRDDFVQNWNDNFLVEISVAQGVAIVRGKAKLVSKKVIKVTNANKDMIELKAEHAVVLATGSEPAVPSVTGLTNYWTPRDATSADHVPEHLIIIGAGVVACEMATVFATFGGKVTIIGSSAEVLPRCEPEASRRVGKSLTDLGVTLVLSKRVVGTAHDTSVKLSTGEVIKGSTILLATGRRPRTYGIGLEELGLKPNLELDESLCTGGWLYAIGDANNRNPLTHMGAYQARRAAAAIIARANGDAIDLTPFSNLTASADHASATQVIMTDPNVASVGLTLAEARERGMKVEEVTTSFMFPGAFVHAELNYDGWAQWVVDITEDRLVGATFVGREAADLLHGSTVALVGKVKLQTLRHAVPSFPTMSEVYVALLETWETKRKLWN